METGGEDRWWRQVVETGGGDRWWRRVVETGDGDGRLRRVVETGLLICLTTSALVTVPTKLHDYENGNHRNLYRRLRSCLRVVMVVIMVKQTTSHLALSFLQFLVVATYRVTV